MGFKVQRTAATGDFGADLLIKKDGRMIAVQAKRYNKSVGVEAVQQVSVSMPYYKTKMPGLLRIMNLPNQLLNLLKKAILTLLIEENW